LGLPESQKTSGYGTVEEKIEEDFVHDQEGLSISLRDLIEIS
jgi:hypothetical protein